MFQPFERQGLTGILLYGKGRFVQLLEGEPSAVEALYAKIAVDPRHQQLFELCRQSVSTRDLIANLLEQMR